MSNMVAIRLSTENIPTILATESISPEELSEVMKKTVLCPHRGHNKYYFVPTHDGWVWCRNTWTWVRDDLFEDGTMTADLSKIDTQFVPLTRN